MTILGTRPELIKMCRVIAEFDIFFDHIFVHSGQNYDYNLNQVFFDELGIRKPDYFLGAEGKSSIETITDIINKVDSLLDLEVPDAIVYYGDTNTSLSIIAAKKRKIPIFHMEAGNRCFDQRVPEELNRKIVDHLSDINMVLTEHARRYLIDEGIKPETIFKTGSHLPEVLNFYKSKILKSKIIDQLNLKKKKYFLASIHRQENVDAEENLLSILKSFKALVEKYNLPFLVSLHPRTKEKLNQLKIKSKLDLDLSGITFLDPLGFFDYIYLQSFAFCVLSDSGTITEEASILNFPAINLRNSHERPEGMDSGSIIMSGLKQNDIMNAVNIITEQYQIISKGEKALSPNENNHNLVSIQVTRIISSYISYTNRTVWFLN